MSEYNDLVAEIAIIISRNDPNCIIDDKELDFVKSGHYDAHAEEIIALVEPVIRAKVGEESNDDAKRYQFLRNADIDSVQKGGIFAGVTPENIVLNGDDLDEAIDAAIKESV